MERTLVTAQSLRILLNLEIATLEGCEGMEVGDIVVHPVSDGRGCNWDVVSFTGLTLRGECRALAEGVISALQQHYNVGRST